LEQFLKVIQESASFKNPFFIVRKRLLMFALLSIPGTVSLQFVLKKTSRVKQSPIAAILWFINSFCLLKTSNMLIWKIKEADEKEEEEKMKKPDHKTWNLQEAWSL